MPVRRLPVRPDLKQLHRQAKELLRALHPAIRMRSQTSKRTIPGRPIPVPPSWPTHNSSSREATARRAGRDSCTPDDSQTPSGAMTWARFAH